MKYSLPHLAVVGAFLLGLTFIGTALAQEAPGSPRPGDHDGMLSFLSPEDRAKLLKARDEVLAANPDLKTEEEALKQKRENASPDDREALFRDFKAHEKKMRDAMLQVDPTLQPIFDQIDQHMKERFKERQQNGGSPQPPPPQGN